MVYVSQLGEKDLNSDYLFTTQRESHSVPDGDFFAIPSLILSHMKLSRIDLLKLTSHIFMDIVTIPIALVDEFYFHMHHPIKAWLFEKLISELVYLCIFI